MTDIDTNNIRLVDGGLLLVFRGLLRHRRTTLVGRELGLSQSAISHALARLRDIFDDPLFTRRPHGLQPTRRALELGPRIDALIDQIGDAIERKGSFTPRNSKRRFAISAPEFVTALVGANLVSSFRKLAPQAQIDFGYLSPARALEALRRGEIDMALGRFGELRQEFISEEVYRDRYCIVARRSHPILKGRISLSQYYTIGHVFAYSESEMGPSEGTANTTGIAFTAAMPGWLVVLATVAGSDGIATVPRKLAERMAKLMGLQVIKPPFEPLSIEVSAVRRAGSADAGIDWLFSEIRKAIAVKV